MASIKDLKNQLAQQGEPEPQEAQENLTEREFTAESIDEALEQACSFFNTSRMNMDYEITQQGRSGLMGIGKRPFKVLVWLIGVPSTSQVPAANDGFISPPDDFSFGQLGSGVSAESENAPVDGKVKVIIRKSGVFLKVTPSKNGGRNATIQEAQMALVSRNIKSYNQSNIKKIVDETGDTEVKIADWTPNTEYDSKTSLEISPDEMKAYVTVTAPILSGRILEPEEIYSLLDANAIVFGIMKDKIISIFEKDLFNVPVLVAEGKPPQHGANADVEHKFKTERGDHKYEENEQGRVDYRNVDNVQNVVAGQVLAVKHPATLGIPGRTVTNNRIDAKNGEDIPFEAGKNTILSENKLEIIAQIAGQAILLGGSVHVEPIYEVKGDVDLNTGNIIFLGTVLIKGNIQDGFSVKAAGNIEVKGSINKAEVEADNEVIVGQGILGQVKAGTNVFAKYIENAKVTADNDIIVKEEILHSKIDAGNRVICHGKKGYIVGGQIRAGQEISAKYLGSTAYTDTYLESGVDPKSKEKLIALQEEKEANQDQLNKLDANISTLQRAAEAGTITEDKKTMLDRLVRARKEFELQDQEISEDITELKTYLENLDTKGKISAKVNVYPGVDLTIKSANFFVKTDFKGVTFVNENNFIKPQQYQPFEGEDDKH